MALTIPMVVKNVSDKPQRYRVHIFLDNGKAVCVYIFIDLQNIFDRQGDWSQWDIAVGITLGGLALEPTCRVIGLNLTRTGLRFSSLVVSLSQGIPILVLVAFTSLLLGMGLPVIASYIVLVILAGPGPYGSGYPSVDGT